MKYFEMTVDAAAFRLHSTFLIAGWSSPVARQAHNLKAAGSNPAPATFFLDSNPRFQLPSFPLSFAFTHSLRSKMSLARQQSASPCGFESTVHNQPSNGSKYDFRCFLPTLAQTN
jgi:hypothetical protein